MTHSDITAAHKFCTDNMPSLSHDERCGCFYCLKVFNPSEIEEYIKDHVGSAICPYCGIDSVIGESSGYPLTQEFLGAMREYWFGFSSSAVAQDHDRDDRTMPKRTFIIYLVETVIVGIVFLVCATCGYPLSTGARL